MHRFFSKAAALVCAAILGLAIAGCEAPSGDADNASFVGTYKTQDTQGNPMTIVLAEDGTATGERAGESMDGSWKEEEGNTVAITWSDEWTTKITMDGDKYTKTAYKDGSQDGDAVAAEKTE